MKKHLRWIIAIIVLAVMGVAYYYYLANKPADKDATESVADSNSELSYLVSRNIVLSLQKKLLNCMQE